MKRAVKGVLKFCAVIACVILLVFILFIGYLHIGKKAALETPVYGLDLSKIDDGTYVGSYEGQRWSNTVSVTLKNHAITKIEVIKPQTFTSQETIDTLISRITSEQRTDVDAVSGATADSKTFLSAVENALYLAAHDALE